MNKRVSRFLVQVFSSLNALFLTFQPLAALPVLLTSPVMVQAEVSLNADAVDLTFNSSSHEFQLRVKTNQALPYVLTYLDEKQDPQIEQAAQGNLTQMEPSVFGANIYAGTCSAGVCTPVNFLRGSLSVGDWFKNSFQLVNGILVFDGPSPAVEQVCVNPEEVGLTAGETLWSVDEATGVAETKTKVQPGVSYQFPLNDAVSVTFSCLPKDESLRFPLKIQQVLVSELSLPDSVRTDATYAYDITTEMTNGSFEYELSLPKAKDTEVAISYIEKTIEEAKTTLSDQDVKTVIDSVDTQVEQLLGAEEISATGLDHFTIFVVVNPDETTANNNVSNPNNAWVSDSNYALYDDRDDYAIYGFPNLGVPTGATIEGVEVNVEGKTTGRDLDISLWNQSNSNPDAYTTAFTADLGSTESTVIVGSPTNLWGKTWTASDFDTNFKIRVDANSNSGTTASLDLVSVKVYYAPVCTNDAQGANDQPGQKDLTRMCINTTSNTTTGIEWNWDEINGSGNNSYDACSLYDTDSDGKANYATCVTLKGSPLVQTASNPISPRIYSCGDTYADKCSSSILVASPYTTTCSVAQKNTDPFAGGDLYPADTVATCSVLLSEVGGANSKLLDVCSYPSQQPNSDPSDCIIAAGNNSAPTATPTSTPTSTPSPTPTETPTSTPTPTPTETPSPTPTSSPTPTATPTPVVCTETSWTCQECEAGPASAPACYGEMWSFCQETYGCDFSQNPNAQVGVWSCPTDACIPKVCGDGTVNQDSEQCDDGNVVSNDGCSATCTSEGHILIRKVTNPDTDTTTNFSFHGNAGGTIRNGGEINWGWIAPGSYSIGEDDPISTGYQLDTITCNDSNSQTPSVIDLAAREVRLNLDPGENLECTFTNKLSARCGDGIVNNQEQCDYGQLNGQSSCSSECTWINDCRETMVANNSFEIPIVSQGAGWDAFDNAEVAGWTANWYGGSASYNGHDRPEPKVEVHRGVNGWLPPAGSQQYVELDTDWTGPVNDFSGEPASIALSQDIPTIIGNQYMVSWKYSARPNHSDNHLQVTVGGTEVFNSGVIAGGSNTDWKTESYTFVATTTLTKISFTELGTPDSLGMFIDDIQATCNGLPTNDVTVCKEDSSGNPLSGWKVGLSQPTGFDQTIPVTNGDGVTTSLSAGAYIIYASGTYRYGNSAMIADAGNSFRPVGIPYGTGGWVSGDDLLSVPGALELKLSGGNITNTNINWGGFNPLHQYSAYVTGFEGDLNLAIWDDYYGDNLNNGGFRAKIDRSYVSGMTGENGCVTFLAVPYGDYQVFEVGDKNWSYVSTTVGPDTITNYPATATVGDQVPEITLTNKFVGGGTIRIVKDVTPDDTQTKFDYTLSNTSGYSVSDKVWEGNPSGYVNLPVGTYTLSELDLPGYVESISCSNNQTSQTNSISFELKTGDDITCTIANSQYGSFSGKKYIDLYGNGQFDPEDTVYEGWKIKLSVHDGTNYQFLTETTTDSSGNYTFSNLLPGMYAIEEDLSSGEYLATDPNAFGLYNAVNLAAGENLSGFDFGNYKGSTIWGYKYEDTNGNGTWDSGEVGLPNWTIYLDDNVNGQLDPGEPSTQTDQDGKYEFTKLPRGQYHGGYSIKEVIPDGWVITYPESNSAWKKTTSGSIERQDFGNFKLGMIQGRKYQDDNFNGTRQTGEDWLGGWTIKLYDSTWNSIDSVVTANTTGLYRFENLNKGTYYTCEVMQTDWKQTGPKDLNANQVVNNSQNPNEGPVCWRSVINQSGQERTGRQFGNAPTYDIHGYKWLDYNHNGVNDQEQLLSGWEIFIDQNNNQQWDDGEPKTTTSSEDGHQGWYWFEGLVAGTYDICEVTQAGWVQTYPIDPNCHTVNLPDLNPLNLDVSLNMVAGPEYNFGNFEKGDMDVWKYEDTDGILGRSGSETWIGDPTFSFRVYEDTNGDGAGGWILKATASTNSEGKAEFTDVFDTVGQYYVCEVTKDGWEDMRSLNNPTNNESGALDEYTVCDGITVPGSGYVRSAEFGNIHRGFVTVNKFLDLNINGKYDSGEELMSGWAMSMEATNGFLATQSTETGGSTQFSLDPNTYFLSETLQDGWEQSNIYCTEDLEGTLITGPGRAYGHHGMCEGWNECGDAATCALKACQAHGYTTLVSYGDARPCTEFENCSLFYDINKDLSYEEDWGNWCPVMGVTDIRCGNYSGPTATPTPTPIEDADASSVIDRILGVTKVSAQPAPDPEGHRIVVTPGSNKTCYVGNYQPGSISGLKYFDENLDGNFDDGESKMQYWGISLSGEGVDEKVVTDENGGFSFVNLKKGTYTLCEEDRTAWGWQVTEPAQPIDKVCREVTIDQSAETEIANFGNFIDSRLYILKINNAWPDDVTIGDEVTYTIRVMAVGGPVHDANVFDVPPKQFTYVPDSYTAQSSDGTDLRANGTTGDPNYQSPGTWTLGDLDKDEIVTLTYKTKVGNLADPGVYPDMVWATGTSEQSDKTGGETSDLLALSDPEFNASSGGVDFDGSQGHFGENNFAGTQVAIVVDQTPFSEFQVGRTEEKQGAVLGASTELPATGARAWLTFLALLSILAGAGLLIMSKGSRQSSPKLLVGLLLVGCSLWFAQPAQALTSVRIEEPYNNSAEFTLDAMTSQTNMKIDFVVLNTENISVTAQCQQQKNDGAWSNITTNYTVKAGGNSGYCEAKDLENNQNYDFRVIVSGDGADKISEEVRVGLDTKGPDKPVNYSKNPGNYCEDKIGFKTANDGQTTSVEVYRSTDNDHFTAKPDTRVITIPIGPNQEYTLTTSKPNCDDTYFYVIRAFDVNGNASDLVGDQEIKTVIIQSSSGSTQTVQLGAIPAGSSFIGGGTTGGSTSSETTQEAGTTKDETATSETTEEPTKTDSSEGTVLGSATETFMSFLSRFGLPIGVGLIVLAGLYIIFFGKRNEK